MSWKQVNQNNPTVREFASKYGIRGPTVYYWINRGKIPFQSDGVTTRIIEAEAVESPMFKAFFLKKKDRVKPTIAPVSEAMPKKEVLTPVKEKFIKEFISHEISINEKLFLTARYKAKPFIERAKACREAGKVNAEAELLWMAVQEMGFKI